ncbi:MAG: hypothetical protein KatS3mg044_1044 [Rhodothermaceae bacterium]|nr:MAG: hypothetical protein KatS3mg044_1044 [Rhodothermaceae bacterium]
MMAPSSPEPLPPGLQRGLSRALHAAARTLQRRARVARLLRAAYGKLRRHPKALARVRGDLQALARLVRAWVRGTYRVLPWRSLVYAVAALIYFVNPADVLPDALVGLGFVDDVAVVTAVVRALRADLEAFIAWETGHTAPPVADAAPYPARPTPLPAA